MSNDFISSVWDFKESGRDKSNHDLFRWFGVLPPQLVNRIINLYSKDNDTVLANFSGSGTVALECLITNRKCIAVDSNPLSIMQTRVKTNPFDFDYKKFVTFLDSAERSEDKNQKNDLEKKWFRNDSLSDLYFLRSVINDYSKNEIEKEFLLLVLASVVKKSSLVDSRCINHIVIDKCKRETNTIDEFLKKLEEATQKMELLHVKTKGNNKAQILRGDARCLSAIPSSSIDLIISHPPYLGNVDYTNINQLENFILGNDAEIIIWIVKDVREEHQRAIDWLNEHTDENIYFFAIKMELWQIGDSPYAPKFQVISKPNDWAKAIKKTSSQGNMTETRVTQLEFWNQFILRAKERGTTLRLRKASAQHWYDISLGNSMSHISLTINSRDNKMACEVYISDNKNLYDHLAGSKEAIEKDLGHNLIWMPLEGKKASRIKSEAEFDLEGNWFQYFDWLNEEAENFLRVFPKYIKKFKA